MLPILLLEHAGHTCIQGFYRKELVMSHHDYYRISAILFHTCTATFKVNKIICS